MYIHIGGGYVLKDSDVIGFFDIDGSYSSSVTKDFLKRLEMNAGTDAAGEDLPRSFVLYDENGETTAVLTHISTSALKLRAEKNQVYGEK